VSAMKNRKFYVIILPFKNNEFSFRNFQRYKGHTGEVRSISVDPTGQWLASGI